MITSTIRNATDEEKQHQIKRLPGIYKRIEDFVVKLIIIIPILLAPLLIYDKSQPVKSNIQAVYCIVVVILAVMISFWLTKKYEGGFTYAKQINEIKTQQVEVVRIQTARAIKREDPEDFGIAYYVSVIYRGRPQTLYLWGQYLDDLEYENVFPNTEFEFVRQIGSDEFIDFKTLGHYFKEEQTLPAFGNEVWKNGNYPINGQLLDQSIDEIL